MMFLRNLALTRHSTNQQTVTLIILRPSISVFDLLQLEDLCTSLVKPFFMMEHFLTVQPFNSYFTSIFYK